MTTPACHALLALVLSTTGCAGEAASVIIDIPAPYRGEVRELWLEVLAPSRDAPITCGALAFREVVSETLDSARVQEVSLSGADRNVRVPSLPRAARLIIHAVGRDAQRVPLTEGCGEVAAFARSSNLTLRLSPIIDVRLPELPADAPFPARVDAAVTDAEGRRVPGVPARWTISGPHGETSSGESESDLEGKLALGPLEVPSFAGPAALLVRARWQRGDVASRPSFRQPRPLLEIDLLPSYGHAGAFDGGAERHLFIARGASVGVGRLGPGGEMGFGVASATGIHLAYYLRDTSSAHGGGFQVVPTRGTATALFVVPGEPRDRLVAATRGALVEVTPDGQQVPTPFTPPHDSMLPLVVLPVGACEAGAGADRLLFVYPDGLMRGLTPAGEAVDTPFALELSDGTPPIKLLNIALAGGAAQKEVFGGQVSAASGCVRAKDGSLHRTVLLASGFEGAREVLVMAEIGTALHSMLWSIQPASVGFDSKGSRGVLLGEHRSGDALVMGEYQLEVAGAYGLKLVQVGERPVLGDPLWPQLGDLDGDGADDLVALSVRGLRGAELLVGLGGDKRVLAAARLPGVRWNVREFSFSVLDQPFRMADFDGDGVDDLLVAHETGVSVLGMGRDD